MIAFLDWIKVYLLSSGHIRTPGGIISIFIGALSCLFTAFTIWLSTFGCIDPFFLGTIFVCFMLSITFLSFTVTKNTKADAGIPIIDNCLSIASILIGIYMIINMERYLTRIAGIDMLTSLDFVLGTILIILTLEGTRRTLGPGLTIVTIVFIAYNLFGHFIPGYFSHRELGLNFFVDAIAFTNDGIMGVPIKVAATYVFLFVFFGALLSQSGGGDFFYDLAAVLTGKTAGGPAKIAVISSGLFGMISGSPTAGVATTGSITIPMMQKMGYDKNFAGAVETVASSGGSIMPPIMGTAAFLMVEYAGVSYLRIIEAAIIPALLYYWGCFVQVHLHSKKIGLKGFSGKDMPKLFTVLKLGFIHFLPLVLLVILLLKGFTPSYAAVAVIFACIGISWLKKEKRLTPKSLYLVVQATIPRMAPIAMACASAGIVVGGIMITGLGGKFMSLIFTFSGGYLLPTLVITMVVCIVLGMGMPVPSAYVLTAVLAAPALIKLGVNALAAHLFVVYFAVVSAITPPVAVAAYAAAAIAQGDPLKIAIQALKLGIAAFLVPFFFALEPALLMDGNLFNILFTFLTAFIGITMIGVGLEGFLFNGIVSVNRMLFLLGGIVFAYPGFYTDLLGMILLVLSLITYYYKSSQKRIKSSKLMQETNI